MAQMPHPTQRRRLSSNGSPGGDRTLRVETLEDRRMLAAQFDLLADVNAIVTSDGSEPGGFTAVGNHAYFTASTRMHGRELWRTDGTTAGTHLVKDIGLGRADGEIGGLTNVNGTLFFFATTPGTGRELWKSDGTEAGTVLVKDIVPGPGDGVGGFRFELESVGGVLMFCGISGAGSELWRSDGTAAGTYQVKDIQAGSASAQLSTFTEIGGALFFVDEYSGKLWRSDGTTAGTQMVSPSWMHHFGDGSGQDVVEIGGTVYFSAWDSREGLSIQRLYKTNLLGTSVTKVSDAARSPIDLTNVGGTLMFVANDEVHGYELWRSNGTSAGTYMVKDIRVGAGGAFFGGNPYVGWIADGDTLYFSADDETDLTGPKLWKSNGTAAGTVMITPTTWPYGSPTPQKFMSLGGTVYFAANGLWTTDGTAAGTVRLHEFGSQHDPMMGSVGETLLLQHRDSTRGYELFRSGGTPGGLQLLKDINGDTGNASPEIVTKHRNAFYYIATDGLSSEWRMWRTDGTSQGTARVTFASDRITSVSEMASVGDFLYFVSHDPVLQRDRLWRVNGDLVGVVAAEAVNLHAAPTRITGLINVDGILHFGAFEQGVGLRLNKIEPGAGPAIYALFPQGSEYGVNLTQAGGTLYFSSYDSQRGYELWKTDGTSAGTRPVRDINPGPEGSNPDLLTNVNGTLYFVTHDDDLVASLWKTNGTAAGTTRVMQLTQEPDERYGLSLANVGGVLYFKANDGVHGMELWKTDGTAAGTVMVRDIRPGSSGSQLYDLAELNGMLYFAADDGAHGYEIWKSDGTLEGTFLVRDVHVGLNGGKSIYLSKVDDAIYVGADDGVHGRELWRIGASGMSFVGDATGDSGSSDPQVLGRVNGRLVMIATVSPYGRELWSALENVAAPSGDFDADGDADGADFLAWQRALGSIAAPPGSGADGDASGTVDAGDLEAWQSAFGAISGTVVGASALHSSGSLSSELQEANLLAANDHAATDALFAAGDFTSLFDSPAEHGRFGRRGVGWWRRG
jgi:ELWxxDGT repeat protein